MKSKQYAQVGKQCVACGSCQKVCPKQAITLWKGVTARIDAQLCVGCGRCQKECPAETIVLTKREGLE